MQFHMLTPHGKYRCRVKAAETVTMEIIGNVLRGFKDKAMGTLTTLRLVIHAENESSRIKNQKTVRL